MEHFKIRGFDDEPDELLTATHYQYDSGNWRFTHNGNINVLAFEDEGEAIEVFVAAKRRYGTIDEPQAVRGFSGSLAGGMA